jgi:polysaccharide biosynthesis protein PslE
MLEIRSFRDLLRLFFIFRREFQWAVVATVLVAVLGAFLLPAKYESNARLLVKPGRESTTLPIEAGNRQALIAPSTQRDPIVDEERMLTGRPIVRLVAERYLELTANYQPKGFWKTVEFYIGKVTGAIIEALRSVLQLVGIVEAQSPVDRLAKRLEKNFTVGHEPGSAVMEISFTWSDPAIAQKVVETWINAYLEERTRALSRNSLYAFYDTEMHKVAGDIDQLKHKLGKQLKAVNSISVEERLDNLTNQINRITDSRGEKLNDQAGIRSFLADARLQLKRQPQEVITAREISLNPSQLDLKRRLNALKQERAELLRSFLPSAPPVRELEENIGLMEVLIRDEDERLERSKNLAPNSIVVNLKQQIIDAELRDRQLAGQIRDFDQQLSALSTERLRIMQSEPAISRLMLELASAEKSYALYAENLEKARIDQALDTSQISNIATIEQATHNPSRVFPKSLMILLLALPAGLAVGLLTLYICYLLDQRIHDGARIEEAFKVPLWTTLQDLGAPPWQRNSGFTASIYRLYSLLPSEGIERKGLTLALTSGRTGEGVSFVIEHLATMLLERGHQVRFDAAAPAQAGEVRLLDASALLSNEDAFLALRHADLIALVIEAKTSTVPAVQNTLSVLTTAFGQVDGIILNKRQFEVPGTLLQVLNALRGGEFNVAWLKMPRLRFRARRSRPIDEQSLHESATAHAAEAPAPTAYLPPQSPIANVSASGVRPSMPIFATSAPLLAVPGSAPQATPDASFRAYAWGSSTLLKTDARHQLLLLTITSDAGLAAHYHLHRRKRWIVLNGLLQLDIDGQTRRMRAGEIVEINEESVHALRNIGKIPAELYEVQMGEYFGDEDITLV